MKIYDNTWVFNTCVVSSFPQPRENDAHFTAEMFWIFMADTFFDWVNKYRRQSHNTGDMECHMYSHPHFQLGWSALSILSMKCKTIYQYTTSHFSKEWGRYCDTISKMNVTQASKLKRWGRGNLGFVIWVLPLKTKQNIWLMVVLDTVLCTWINYHTKFTWLTASLMKHYCTET